MMKTSPVNSTTIAAAICLFSIATGFGTAHAQSGETNEVDAGQEESAEDLQAKLKAQVARLNLVNTLDSSDVVVFPSDGKEQGVVTAFIDTSHLDSKTLFDHIDRFNSNGYTVQFASYAVDGEGSTEYTKWPAVLCSSEPKEALGEMIFKSIIHNDNPEVTESCNESTALTNTMANKLSAYVSPTLVLPYGTQVDGLAPFDWILEEIENETSVKAAPSITVSDVEQGVVQ